MENHTEIERGLNEEEILLKINEISSQEKFDSVGFLDAASQLIDLGIEEDSAEHEYVRLIAQNPQFLEYMLQTVNEFDTLAQKDKLHLQALKNALDTAETLGLFELRDPQLLPIVDYLKLIDKKYQPKKSTRRNFLIAAGALGGGLLALGGAKVIHDSLNIPSKPAPKFNIPPDVKPAEATQTAQARILTPEPTPKVEAPVFKPNAVGELTLSTGIPTLIGEATGKELPIEVVDKIRKAKRFNVMGYGSLKDNTFLCFDPESKIYFEIPINQLQIKEGSPVKEVPRASYLGVRNDASGLMSAVPELGASKVRIVCNDNSPEDQARVDRLEVEASKLGLNILCVYNPSSIPSNSDIQHHMERILKSPNITLELGNEPDETENGYWTDYNKTKGSFESFAKFIKTSIDIARKIRPDVKIIIGALADPLPHQQLLVNELKKQGVDISKVDFAVHAYSQQEINERIPWVQKVTERKNVVVTELGHNSQSQDSLPRFIEEARGLGASDIYLHELPSFEENWGLVDPGTKLKSPRFYFIQKMVIDQKKKGSA